MESRAKVLGHPLHQMLIPFPLGLLGMAAIFDLISLFTDGTRWNEVAYYMIGAGLIAGVIAMIPGWIDWSAIPAGTRAKRVGLVHGVGNVMVLMLFTASWALRRGDEPFVASGAAITTSLLGFALAGFTGWLGGELVDRLGIGVDDGANVNASNSLSGRPAREIAVPGYRGADRRQGPVAAEVRS